MVKFKYSSLKSGVKTSRIKKPVLEGLALSTGCDSFSYCSLTLYLFYFYNGISRNLPELTGIFYLDICNFVILTYQFI